MELLQGEFRNTSMIATGRLSIPKPLLDQFGDREKNAGFMLTKERPGCLSLWMAQTWGDKLRSGTDLVLSKLRAGKLERAHGGRDLRQRDCLGQLPRRLGAWLGWVSDLVFRFYVPVSRA